MTTPVHASNRHLAVDALRGFSLLGILLVNIEYLTHPIEIGWVEFTSTQDLWVRGFVQTVGQLKIYPIFALLFGYGFALQVDRSGDELGPRYRRRMYMLIALGVLHGVLFFPGDILVLYGLVGLLAYRVRDWSSRKLLTVGGWIYGVNAFAWLALGALDGTVGDPATGSDFVKTAASGSFIEVVGDQAPIWFFTMLILFLIQGPVVVASYFAGMALGRTDWLANPGSHLDKSSHALRWFPIGLAVAAVGAWIGLGLKWDTLGSAIGIAAAPVVAAGFVALVVRAPVWLQKLLQPSGRMSLTIYLLESVVAAVLSMGYGFGLIGRFDPLGGIGLTVAIFAGLSVFAHLWMGAFRFGPFEWLLRSVSYGDLQPMRSREHVTR